MKKIFAIILAVAVIATSLPLAFLSFATAPDFDDIFANYQNVASKTYFDNNTAINTAGFVAGYDNVSVNAAGLGCRDANYLKANAAPGGYVIIEVADDNAIETGLVVHNGQLTATYLTFYTSSDMQGWEQVSDSKIASTEAICTTVAATPNTTDYYLRKQRIAGFPEGTRYLKVEITTAANWQPGLDYIDVFQPDRFAMALEGYETTPSKTYFDTNLAITAEGYVAGYNNVGVYAAGLGYREGNYAKPDSTSNAWVAIEVNDTNVIETGLVIHNGRLNDTSLDFYTSSDMLSWSPVSAENIASTEAVSDKNSSYYLRKERVYSLPEGTRYLKIVFNVTTTWQPGLDYVDVYAPDRFDNAFNEHEDSPSKIYFDDNTNIDAEGFVAGYSNVTRLAAGLGCRDANYVKPNSTDGGYVIIEVNDDNAVETGLVIHKSHLLTTYLTFYTSSDMQNWAEIDDADIARSENLCATVNNPPNTTDYNLRRERISTLPEGTRYLKIEITTSAAWQPGLDYIDVYAPKQAEVSSSEESSSEESSSAESSSEESSSEESSSAESSSEESSSEESSSADSSSEEASSEESSSAESSSEATSSDNVSSGNSDAEFDALTNGYEIEKQLLSETYKLDNAVFIGSTNWNFGKYGLKYRDEYSTQRPSNSNGDAEIILSVNDGNIVEVATVLGSGCLDYTTNTYYTSADGVNWTPVSAANVYTKTLTSTDPVPEGYFAFGSGYTVRLERIISLPAGTLQLKIVTSTENRTSSWWQPGIEYIDLYKAEGTGDTSSDDTSSDNVSSGGTSSDATSSDGTSSGGASSDTVTSDAEIIKKFNALTKGFEITKSLISAKETLDSRAVVSYKNWRFSKAGFNYRDEYSTQRPNGVNEDAEIVLSVNDGMIVEVATVISESRLNTSSNTYYVSVDGEKWVKLSDSAVHTIELAADYPTPEGYVGLREGYVVRRERVTSLPKGVTQLKVVTSTGNAANSWWQPGIEYIDLYEKEGANDGSAEREALKKYNALTEGYEVTKSLISPKETLDSKSVLSYKNWRFAKANLNWRDEYSTQRFQNANEDAELVLKVTDDMIIEVATVISESRVKKSNNTYYVSEDGKKWKKISAEMIELDRSFETPNGYVGLNDGFIVRLEKIIGLPNGTTQLKIVTSTENEANSWWQPGIEYIDIYEKEGKAEEQIKLFDSLTEGYEVVTSLISKNETLDSKAILSYKNWRFAKAGLDWRDEYSTQRPNGVNADAEIILKVTDDTITEVATVINEGRISTSNNTYYASADGKKWTKLSDSSVYVKELNASAAKPTGYIGLKTGYIVRIERIVALPKGTTQLKVVTSTGNAANSWWQPGIEYIDIYEPVTESKLSGYELEKELITETSKLDDPSILGSSNLVFNENGISFKDSYSLSREDYSKKAELILAVKENMPIEIGFTVFAEDYSKLKVTYYTSADGKVWTALDAKALFTRRVRSVIDSSLDPNFTGRIDLIAAQDSKVKQIKAVISLEGGNVLNDTEINYVKLYKEYIDPFDTVLDGYRVVETLLTPTSTIEAQTILSYKNWRFGKMGLPFFDEVGTQRYTDKSEDAEIIISVDDAMAVEVATVIAKSLEGCTTNTYYASADGKTWTLIDPAVIYSKRFTAASDNLLTETSVGLIERVMSLPEGTTMVKIVTSTENRKNSWWQPSINRIALYKDPFDSAVDGMVIVDKTEGDSLSSDRIVSNKNGELVLEVVDTMTVEIAMNSKGTNKFYVSADMKNWVELSGDYVHSRTAGDTVLIRISNMPEGVRFLKLDSSGSSVKYVRFYDNKVDEFDLTFVGYGRTDTLFDATRKLNDALVISYENWHYGTNGYSFLDQYSLQRDSENCKDASLVLSVRDNQALEFGFIISNSWLKKTVTEYYVSEDAKTWKKLDSALVLGRYYTTDDDSRVAAGYHVLAERVTDLPDGTAYIKLVVSTGNEKNSWWQPGVDYVDIYTPYEELSLEQIAAQTDKVEATIQFTSEEDGLGNSYIFSSKNLTIGKFGISYTDEYSARRFGYNDSEIVLEVTEDAIIELATVIDNSLEFCAENKFYTSTDGELWVPFDAGMLLNAKVTEGVSANCFARVQLLSELPSDTKYVKIISTTNGVTASWKNFAIDYITIYKGESTFKVKPTLDGPTIMLVGNFMQITLSKNQMFTVDDLTALLDAGKSQIFYYTADNNEVFDGMTEVVSGMKLVLKRNNKAKKEYIISITYLDDGDKTVDTPNEAKPNIPLIAGIAVAGGVVIAGGVLLVIYLKRKKARS